ncbi:MAG: GNAT family N-acetyltransferase [Geodermatophilaceae bacterium]|nr:GNAT family N-acetyltransferase [Geodermatophilaceae bacterium]
MLDRAALCDQGTLHTARLRLEPLGDKHFSGVWASLADGESRRLTGTHAEFTEDAVRRHLARVARNEDRADWAILDATDGRYLGEVVLNNLDADNVSMNFRIALSGGYGRGVGTEATRAVVAHGFDVIGLHRISLGVYAFNPRAIRVYEKCGFRREGVARDALHWDGAWHGQITMAILTTDPR